MIITAVSLLTGCQKPVSEEAVTEKTETAAEENTGTVYASLKQTNSWQEDGKTVCQYVLQIENHGDKEIHDWQVKLAAADSSEIRDLWNAEADVKEGTAFILKSVEYNNTIAPSAVYSDAGMIVKGAEPVLEEITFMIGSDTIVLKAGELQKPHPVYQHPDIQPAKTAGIAGKLYLDGTKLKDEKGDTVQLQGISLHGIAWFPQYVDIETFRTLRDEWGANLIRIPLYTAEYGGYCSGGDQQQLKELVDKGVQAADELGMYVIIDWHILSDSSPEINEEEAVRFFDEMSLKYKDFDNVIFEICNEPQNSPWESVIRPYAERILKVIRGNGSDALVIVGTNTWSQDIQEVVGSELDDDRVMYAMHFYSSTHKDQLRQRLKEAVEAGLPVFVSECGISEASGSGIIDYESAGAWFTLMYQENIPFAVWNLSNKDETSALIAPDCRKISGFAEEDLSEAGQYIRLLLQKQK